MKKKQQKYSQRQHAVCQITRHQELLTCLNFTEDFQTTRRRRRCGPGRVVGAVDETKLFYSLQQHHPTTATMETYVSV